MHISLCLGKYLKYFHNNMFHFVPKPRKGTWVMAHTRAYFPSAVPTSSRLQFQFTSSFYVLFSLLLSGVRTFPFNLQDIISLWANKNLSQKWSVFHLRCSTEKRGEEWGIGIWYWSVWVINLSSYGIVSTFQPFMLNAYLT